MADLQLKNIKEILNETVCHKWSKLATTTREGHIFSTWVHYKVLYTATTTEQRHTHSPAHPVHLITGEWTRIRLEVSEKILSRQSWLSPSYIPVPPIITASSPAGLPQDKSVKRKTIQVMCAYYFYCCTNHYKSLWLHLSLKSSWPGLTQDNSVQYETIQTIPVMCAYYSKSIQRPSI